MVISEIFENSFYQSLSGCSVSKVRKVKNLSNYLIVLKVLKPLIFYTSQISREKGANIVCTEFYCSLGLQKLTTAANVWEQPFDIYVDARRKFVNNKAGMQYLRIQVIKN